MIKKKSYILLLTLLFTVPLFAQRETANWYFGSNVGLDFNNGNPVLQTDGQLTTTEGYSTVSDNNGSLLFYTNGVNIWNKNHNIMQNGSDLLGSDSGSQSAIVIPNVSNSNIYYVFTADVYQAYTNGNNGNGINYLVVDMSLNAGLGTVKSKNVNLLPQGSEKLSAVSSLDGQVFGLLQIKEINFMGLRLMVVA